MAIVGVGVDAVDIDRVRTAIDRTPGLVDRLFTTGERATCTLADDRLRYPGLAARFAAKEAVAKALGTGVRGFGFRDIEVAADVLGRPEVRLHGPAASVAATVGATRIHLSLSTSRALAVAHAVAESDEHVVPEAQGTGRPEHGSA